MFINNLNNFVGLINVKFKTIPYATRSLYGKNNPTKVTKYALIFIVSCYRVGCFL